MRRGMKYARLSASTRLRRVHKLLGDGRWHSSWEITAKCRVVAPGTCVSELRAQGARVEVEQRLSGAPLQRVWYYRMTRAVPEEEASNGE